MNVQNLSVEEIIAHVLNSEESTSTETWLARLLAEQIDEAERMHVLLDNFVEAGDNLASELRETGDENFLDAWDTLRRQVEDFSEDT